MHRKVEMKMFFDFLKYLWVTHLQYESEKLLLLNNNFSRQIVIVMPILLVFIINCW